MFHGRPSGEPSEVLSFPRGTVKREDCIGRMAACCMGLDGARARRILGSELAPERALGFWVAAARILYEDHGVLLCTTKDGGSPDFGRGPLTQNFREKYSLLIDGNLDFMTFLESEGLYCDLNRLAYFSHWNSGGLTPPTHGTRIFLARLPYPVECPSSGDSSFESMRITPEKSLALLDQGGVRMDFPTFATLRTLVDFDNRDALWGEYTRSERPNVK